MLSQTPPFDALTDANLRTWNERVSIHLTDKSGVYDVAGFLAGADTLMPIEAAEIGDVAGMRLAHLQCHFGLDTLSLARRGAIVTGLDFAPDAITAAKTLSADANLPAVFVEGNVYDAPMLLGRAAFDIVYVSWGALCWLPDIRRWADVVAELLVPGGRLYLADAHPSLLQLEEIDGHLVATHPWRSPPGAPLVFNEPQSYAGDGRELVHRQTLEWLHPLSDILSGLLAAGMRVDAFAEHDTLPWPAVPMAVTAPGRMFRLPDGVIGPPLSFSLQATKTPQ